jgi:hypothetical protein
MMTRNEIAACDRRANMARQIEHRDDLINMAIEAANIVKANPSVTDVSDSDLRRVMEIGEALQQWIDSDYIVKSYPGVRARLMSALETIEFSREAYAQACAELARRAKPANVKGVHTCPKCSGRGRLDWASHIDGGVCFSCGGSGKIEIK